MNPFRREFEYFLLICETLNLSVAAERAGIQQAGLSKSLKQLESELAKPLFYRTNRGLKLTPFGSSMRKNLLDTLGNWETNFDESLETLQECSGSLSIGAHPTIAINTVSKAFAGLCENNINLYLNLNLKKSLDVTKDVLNFHIDIGMVANPVPHQDLVIKTVANEHISIWGQTDRAEQKVIYYNPEMIRVVQNIKKYKDYKKVEVADYEVIAAILQHAGGVGILPSPVGQRNPRLSQMGKVLEKVSICLIYRYDVVKTRAFREVLEQLSQSQKQI